MVFLRVPAIMKLKRLLPLIALLLAAIPAPAQNTVPVSLSSGVSQDVFTPIGKYFQAGDYNRLSAWFADNLELDLLGSISTCSRNQARRIMKDFFADYTPKSFEIVHKSGKTPMRYAIGVLHAGGETFQVTLYVRTGEGKSVIQQLKIERQ